MWISVISVSYHRQVQQTPCNLIYPVWKIYTEFAGTTKNSGKCGQSALYSLPRKPSLCFRSPALTAWRADLDLTVEMLDAVTDKSLQISLTLCISRVTFCCKSSSAWLLLMFLQYHLQEQDKFSFNFSQKNMFALLHRRQGLVLIVEQFPIKKTEQNYCCISNIS